MCKNIFECICERRLQCLQDGDYESRFISQRPRAAHVLNARFVGRGPRQGCVTVFSTRVLQRTRPTSFYRMLQSGKMDEVGGRATGKRRTICGGRAQGG